MKAYILSVTAAAILAAVMQKLPGSETMRTLVRLIAGIFMAVTVMAPIVRLELPDTLPWLAASAADGQAAAAEGTKIGNDAVKAIISERTEAYIMDKAAAYGADLEVQVTLDDAGIPACVTLTGPVSPYAKANLSQVIALDLGLGEEVQQWIS